MEWNIVIIIGLIGTICGITFGYVGYSQGKKKENLEDGALGADIKYIMRRTDEVLLEQKDTNRNINAIGERVTIQEVRLEEGFKAANFRIDGVVGDLKDYKKDRAKGV